MFWKKHKWKVIISVCLIALLAFTFWFGGNAPGLQGWKVEKRPTATEAPAPTPTAVPTPVPTTAPAAEIQGDVEYSIRQGMQFDPETGKDKYGTTAVPEGKPIPVEPDDDKITDEEHICTISISCATILDNMDWLDKEKTELIPKDGWILRPIEITFYEGESVFHVLRRTCKQQGIHMEFVNTPIYNSAYIEGIHNLYEFDCGEGSGWMFAVNGWYPNYGCSRYAVKEGDVIEWNYTCTRGDDLGASYAVGG